MIIGISGTLSSGKDTVAEYLENKGYKHISLSAILREVLTEKNMEINMKNLTEVGNQIGDELINRALKRIDSGADTIISSIRQPVEIEILKDKQGINFVMVFVDARARLRFERLRARGRLGDSKTFEEFVATEKKQSTGEGGMNLSKCKKMADYIVENNATPDDLYAKVDKTIKEIKER